MDELVSLDHWVTEEAGQVRGKDRQYYIAFQKDWSDGHYHNSLLYPLNLGADVWRANFDWFKILETYNKPDQENKKTSGKKTMGVSSGVKIPAPNQKPGARPTNLRTKVHPGENSMKAGTQHRAPGAQKNRTGNDEDLNLDFEDLGTMEWESVKGDTDK